MINNIKYYYNLNVDDIKQIGDDYYFDNYVLKKYYKEIDLQLYFKIVNNGFYLHQIIYNRNNEYITNINNTPYVLLKISKKTALNYDLIKNYNIQFNNKSSPDWATLWETKIDYIEKNADNIKDDIIKKTINYYIGIAEEAIIIYKSLKLNNNYCLCHMRFNNDISFYDPFNIVVDYKMRDFAEYFKKEIMTNDNDYYQQISDIVINNNYNDVMLFFIRMMFPTSFFDAYDDYIKNSQINYSFFYKKDKYEKYLKYIYQLIRKKYNIIKIEWLK